MTKTSIEWTDETWNPVTGCTVHSDGCKNCYAMQLAGTRLKNHPSRKGLTRQNADGKHIWTGEVRFNENWLTQPLHWKKARMIFVCAHGDLFHEDVPDHWIDRVFAIMALCPQHIFQVLTKRSDRMREWFSYKTCQHGVNREILDITCDWQDRSLVANRMSLQWPLPNIWLGTSVENQESANTRIPDLLNTPAAIRWLSCEPLLGPVDLTDLNYDGITLINSLSGKHGVYSKTHHGQKIDWVVAGGESGQHARPMHPDWVRQLRDQCADTNTPFFFKQWGEWAPGECDVGLGAMRTAEWWDDKWHYSRCGTATGEEHRDDEPDVYRCGKTKALRTLDGKYHDAFPQVNL